MVLVQTVGFGAHLLNDAVQISFAVHAVFDNPHVHAAVLTAVAVPFAQTGVVEQKFEVDVH